MLQYRGIAARTATCRRLSRLLAGFWLSVILACAQEATASPTPTLESSETPAVATAAEAVSPAAPPVAAIVQIQPPNWADRRNVFFRKLFGGQAILETVPGAIFDTARGFPRQWGRGGLGIAKRLGSQYGQFVVGEIIEAGVSVVHREDPRYFRQPDRHFGPRLGHALASTVIVRGANGGQTIGLARLANVYGAWAVATMWNPPDQRNVLSIAKYGTLGLGIKAGSNVFREFWPDVKRHLRH